MVTCGEKEDAVSLWKIDQPVAFVDSPGPAAMLAILQCLWLSDSEKRIAQNFIHQAHHPFRGAWVFADPMNNVLAELLKHDGLPFFVGRCERLSAFWRVAVPCVHRHRVG